MTAESISLRKILNQVYKDICGFEIPKDEEAVVKSSKGSPLYGEINHQAVNNLLEYLALGPKDVFVDLGSGVGKVVLHAALKTEVKRAIGVELSTTRHHDALEALKRASEWQPKLKTRCQFINADLMTVDLKEATAIYTCSTAFSQGFMKQFTNRLADFTQNFRLITLQELPPTKHFDLEEVLRLDMSWIRKTAVHIYRRR